MLSLGQVPAHGVIDDSHQPLGILFLTLALEEGHVRRPVHKGDSYLKGIFPRYPQEQENL